MGTMSACALAAATPNQLKSGLLWKSERPAVAPMTVAPLPYLRSRHRGWPAVRRVSPRDGRARARPLADMQHGPLIGK